MNYFKGLSRENFPMVKKETYTKIFDKPNKYYGYCQVVIKDENGTKYKGRAFIKKEDAKYYSSITGYKIADHRAYIAYLKSRVYQIQLSIYLLEGLLNTNFSIGNFDKNETRRLKHKMIELKKAKKDIKKKITEAYRYIDTIIAESWKVMDKVEKKIGQKNITYIT